MTAMSAFTLYFLVKYFMYFFELCRTEIKKVVGLFFQERDSNDVEHILWTQGNKRTLTIKYFQSKLPCLIDSEV